MRCAGRRRIDNCPKRPPGVTHEKTASVVKGLNGILKERLNNGNAQIPLANQANQGDESGESAHFSCQDARNGFYVLKARRSVVKGDFYRGFHALARP